MVDEFALANHERGRNLPTLDYFLAELQAYGMDFMAFHEFLFEARIITRLENLERDVRVIKRSIEATAKK